MAFAQLSVFPADKDGNDKRPDFRGSIQIPLAELQSMIDCLKNQTPETNYKDEQIVKLDVSMWDRTSQGGKRYLSGPVQQPYVKPAATDADMPF